MSKEELIEQLKQYIKLCESKDSCNDCIISELFGDCIFTEPPDLWTKDKTKKYLRSLIKNDTYKKDQKQKKS